MGYQSYKKELSPLEKRMRESELEERYQRERTIALSISIGQLILSIIICYITFNH